MFDINNYIEDNLEIYKKRIIIILLTIKRKFNFI